MVAGPEFESGSSGNEPNMLPLQYPAVFPMREVNRSNNFTRLRGDSPGSYPERINPTQACFPIRDCGALRSKAVSKTARLLLLFASLIFYKYYTKIFKTFQIFSHLNF